MPRLRFSTRSRTDLLEIWEHIAAESPRNAEAVYTRLCARCEQLMSEPLAGYRRDDVQRGLRCLNSDGYVIFYRVAKDHVRISRIIHHSRHFPEIDFETP